MSTTHARLDYEIFSKTAAASREALLALGRSTDGSGLEKDLIELVKMRVSQINGCAFCLRIHIDAARRLGAPDEKLDLLATWRDAGVFSAREMAALAWAESLTDLSGGVSDAAYADVAEHFSEAHVAFLSVAIAAINAWNRLGVGFQFAPPPARPRNAS